MQLETISAWSQIVGTLITFIGLLFGIWLQWPEIKKRIKVDAPASGTKQQTWKAPPLMVKLAAVTVILGILLVVFGSTLKERLKDLTPTLSFPSSQAQSTNIRIEATVSGIATTEYMSIINTSERQISLYGWIVRINGQALYSFPQAYIKPGQSIDLHTYSGVDSSTSFHMNLFNSILQSGDVITLFDAAEKQKAEYQIP